MVYLVNSHTNATRIRWHLWEIGLRFTPGLTPGWSFFLRLLSSLELSDTNVYEPCIRARLGTTTHFCEVAIPLSSAVERDGYTLKGFEPFFMDRFCQVACTAVERDGCTVKDFEHLFLDPRPDFSLGFPYE
jgi:hypothetical protein